MSHPHPDEQYRRVTADTEGDIEDQLLADGAPVDISGFQSVAIHIETPSGTLLEADDTGAVTVEDSPTGRVAYQFGPDDLTESGRYRYEWEVTFGDGGVATFPSAGLALLYVRDGLA